MMMSAVILTWNSEEYIGRCLSSLFEEITRTGIEAEVFLIDGGSTDNTVEEIRNFENKFKILKPILLEKNYGTTKSRNLALKQCQGEYIFVLDSDTEVNPGAFSQLIESMQRIENAGIVAPQLRLRDGSIQPSAKRFPTLWGKALKFMPLNFLVSLGERSELYPKLLYEGSTLIEVDHCISAAWLIRKAALDEVGLLDENIFYSPEDVDYCLRMGLHGWKVIYDPNSCITHHTQRISRKKLSFALSHVNGLFYYFRKHSYYFCRRSIYKKIAKVHKSK